MALLMGIYALFCSSLQVVSFLLGGKENNMGCFTGLKIKKKKSNQVSKGHASVKEKPQATLPEPVIPGRSLQSAPPSFKTRARTDRPGNRTGNSRARVLSAPSSLDVADEDRLLSMEFEEQEENKNSGPFMKDQRVSNPQPLPLPEPQDTSILKNMGSFKASSSNLTSGPLPLPPFGGLRSFSFKDIAAACQDFSSEKCVSEGLSSVVYVASFGDDASSSKKLEASVTRILSSTQVSSPCSNFELFAVFETYITFGQSSTQCFSIFLIPEYL